MIASNKLFWKTTGAPDVPDGLISKISELAVQSRRVRAAKPCVAAL